MSKNGGVKKAIYKRWYFWVVLVVVLVGVMGNMGSNDKSDSKESNKSTEELAASATSSQDTTESEPVEEPAVPTQAYKVEKLLDDLSENALNAEQTYQDQYIELTGKFTSADSDGSYFSLGRTNDKYGFDSIKCDINDDHIQNVLKLSKGDTVTIYCTVTEIGEIMGYTVDVEKILLSDEQNAADTTSQTDKDTELEVSADTLIEDMENNALAAEQKYNDQKVKVTGKVRTIDSDGEYFAIDGVNGDFNLVSIRCDIDDSMISTVASFKENQKVIVSGKISEIGEIIGYAIDVESIQLA